MATAPEPAPFVEPTASQAAPPEPLSPLSPLSIAERADTPRASSPGRRSSAPQRNAHRRLLARVLKLGAPALLVYGLTFHSSVVRGGSMTPGIQDGDRILVDHLHYVFGDIQRGDIVVLQYPLDPSLDFIKRVIGIPGDEVRIRDGLVHVNGRLLAEPYVFEQDRETEVVTRVEPEHYFVLGDNRPHSSDSREFGQVPRVYLRGKVGFRVWPPNRAGTLD